MTLLAWALLLVQDSDAARLAEALRSDGVEEREEATRKLRKLGRAAVPALETLSRDKDSEVALRARHLLRLIGIAESLPVAVAVALPGVEDRLAGGDPAAWTEVFLEALKIDSLGRKDLLFLLGPAAKGALTVAARDKICAALNHRPLFGAVPDLLPFLSDGEPSIRCRVLELFRVLGAREAVPSILPLLDKDPEPVVRSAAVRTLAQLDAGAEGIAALLDDADEDVRLAAVEALHQLGHRPALAAVAGRLEDRDSEVVGSACAAVAALGGREHAAGLLRALRHERDLVRMQAARALASLGLRDAIPALADRLGDPFDGVRRAAALALARLGARDRAKALVPLLADRFEHVREAAAFALCDLGASEAAPAILGLVLEEQENQVDRLRGPLSKLRGPPTDAVRLLDDERWNVQYAGFQLLAAWGVEGCVPRMKEVARGGGAMQRSLALRALGTLPEGRAWVIARLESKGELLPAAIETAGEAGWKEAVPALRRIAAGGTPWERCAAIRALASAQAREAASDLMILLRAEPAEVRRAAASALAELGVREAVTGIRPLLDDLEALRALALLGDVGLAEALRSAMKDRHPEWRRVAAELAGRMRVRGLESELRALLEDQDWNVPPVALQALGRLGDREAVSLREAPPGLHLASIEAVGRVGLRERAGDLADLLESEDESAVVAAADALARMGARDRIPELHRVLVRAGFTSGLPVALALARLESRAGLRQLDELTEQPPSQPLFWLNAFRASGAWNRFRSVQTDRPLEGTTEEVVGRLAAVAGFPVEWAARPPPDAESAATETRWRRAWRRLVPREGGQPLPDLLEELLEESRFDAVFEGGTLRMMPRDQAAALWKGWWEEERRR